MNLFFELLQMAVGRRESLSRFPSDRDEWETLLDSAVKHNLLGVTFPAMDELHDTGKVPLSVYSRWALAAEKTAEKNASLLEECRKLSALFASAGFRSCVLKGQGVASLYPDPSLRQSGDIDIWVEGSREAVLSYLRTVCPVGKVVYHHCDARLVEGTEVEVHFTPSWMNSPSRNKRLQHYFASVAGEQFSNISEELGFAVPTLRFNAVYLLIHIYRHVLEEGIGLRQLLDYYYLLTHLDAASREDAAADLRKLGLEGFAAAVCFVLQEVFAAPSSILPFSPDSRKGGFLLEEILVSGNFGRYDGRNAHSSGEGPLAHTFRKVKRGLRFFAMAPSEVLCMPVYMLWQYCWRKKKNYLYKGR